MVSFSEGIRLFFQRYTDFSGRSQRSEYWWPMLMNVLVMMVLSGLLVSSGIDLETGAMSSVAMIGAGLIAIYSLVVFIPTIAVFVRRLHDLGLSGWFALLIFVVSMVPGIGLLASIAQIVVGCLRGNEGANKYGESPIVINPATK